VITAAAEQLEAWVDLAPASGRIVPRPELDRETRARVRLVILGLRLNEPAQRVARRRLLRALQRAWKIGDLKYVKAALADGPFRLVSRRFLESKRPPAAPKGTRFDDPAKGA